MQNKFDFEKEIEKEIEKEKEEKIEKQIEKEIEEEKLKSANYKIIRNESIIPIYQKDLEKLKKSNLLSTPFKTKKPSNEINLIFEMLFDEILLIILSYLSPGEIILFSLTCKQAQYICSDYLLWKQIAIKFQDYFSWKYAFFDLINDYYLNYYPNFQLRGIQFQIQEKNRNDPKQKQIQELSKTNEKIKNYFDNSESTIIKTGTYNYQPNFISIKSERLIYIENLENPKQKIEKRGKMIFKGLRRAIKYSFKYQKQQNRINPNTNYNHNYAYYPYNSRKYFLRDLIFSINGIILITTLMILNYYIDSKKEISFPKLFLLSEIDLFFTIFWIIYSKQTYYALQEYYNILNITISGFIFMIMISLKTSKTFNFIPWLFVLLPLIILLIYFIYKLIQKAKSNIYDKRFYQTFIVTFGFLIFVLLFTSLKLDGFIQIKYSNLIYLMGAIEIYLIDYNKKQLKNLKENIFILVLFFDFFVISSLIFLYGDGNRKKLSESLFPIYIILLLPYLFSFYLFFYSGFKLIQKIIRNEN